jgi:1,4-alpha-glucan branching enzyme
VVNFNNWDKDADPMTLNQDGTFSFIMSLNPGVYRYKFVLNGSVWTADPKNDRTQPDNMGGSNSLLVVQG